MRLRAGIQRVVNGIEIQYNTKIITDKQGRECYLSGISGNIATVRYLDTGEFKEVEYNKLKPYLE